jgi:hypothetical protein
MLRFPFQEGGDVAEEKVGLTRLWVWFVVDGRGVGI